MRIAFINNFYNQGGSSLASYGLAKQLSAEHDMSFYGSVDGPFRKKFQELGETHLLREQNLEYDQHIVNLISRFNPDIIHVFVPGEQSLNYVQHLPKCKRFASVLCGQKVGFDQSQFNKILFSSAYQKEISGHINNGEIVRYGVDCKESFYPQKQTPVFGRIASYCPSKMIHDTVYCSNELRDNKFIVAGEVLDPAYFQSIKAYQKHFGNQNLEIKGGVTEEERQLIMNDIDVYHYPSSNEAFCFSILEAFASKKPVISYNNSAISELFGDTEWLCDDFKKLVELSKKMAALSVEERTSIGEANYLKYKQYSTDLYCKKMINIYNETDLINV